MQTLSLLAAKKRQSPRTGFVHFFGADPEAVDTIPIYENFCFALALCREKRSETVLEAKDLLKRLVSFQGEEGNFPIYLHDFPRCYDPFAGLRLGSILVKLVGEFEPVLGPELKLKLEKALSKILDHARKRRDEKKLPPLWELRYAALCGTDFSVSEELFSPVDLWEHAVSCGLQGIECSVPFHEGIGAYAGPTYGDAQFGLEPMPQAIEYVACKELTSRLKAIRPAQIGTVACDALQISSVDAFNGWIVNQGDSFHMIAAKQTEKNSGFAHALRVLWKGEILHSLVLPRSHAAIKADPVGQQMEMEIALPEQFDPLEDDHFEICLYLDAHPENQIGVDGARATVFELGQPVHIRSGEFSLSLRFELIGGEGQFCGHLHRGNRPCQTANVGANLYEAFDWKIGLRTLRRKGACTLKLVVSQ